MNDTVFYSWQSDSPDHTNQSFIRIALEAAVQRLERSYSVDEALRDVPGSPSIFAVIREKIPKCGAFVFDISLLPGSEVRKHCNSSVCVEYGIALATLGERRIIPVFNSSSGRVDDLPFDLKSMGIKVIYNLPSEATDEQISNARDRLETLLTKELRLVLEDPGSALLLSKEEAAIAMYLASASKLGRANLEVDYSAEDLAAECSITPEQARQAVAELVSRGFVKYLDFAGTDSPPAKATPNLFWSFDRYVHGWDPRHDARSIAGALVATSGSGFGDLDPKDFAEQKGWPLRRLNPALEFLTLGAVVRSSSEVHPEVSALHISETSNTRKFLRGEYDPDTRRRS